MYRITLAGIVVLIAFRIFSSPISAQDFKINKQVTYTVTQERQLYVKEHITITNLKTERYPQQLTIDLDEYQPTQVKAYQTDNQFLETAVSQDDRTRLITIDLPVGQVGKHNQTQLWVEYQLNQALEPHGQILEINLPRPQSTDSLAVDQLELLVDNSLGQLAYSSIPPQQTTPVDQQIHYRFSGSELADNSLNLLLGNFSIFDFQLSYDYPRSLAAGQVFQITLPPDTNYQQVTFTDFSKPPLDVTIDQDGNWLAHYKIPALQPPPIQVSGSVKIFPESIFDLSSPSTEQLQTWLAVDQYWQVDHPEIIAIAKQYHQPEEIFNFVTDYLTYDYSQVNQPLHRQGAIAALANPSQASCTEFTDLFIAVARAAGLPTRQLIGHAYSDDPIIKPLSLVTDVLHAWPEYWDESQQTWRQVDPTWHHTAPDADYFHSWDVNHFVLAINGLSSHQPTAAGMINVGDRVKAVHVQVADQFPDYYEDLQVSLSVSPWHPVIFGVPGQVHIKNHSAFAFRHGRFQLTATDQVSLTSPTTGEITAIPPQGQQSIPITIQANQLLLTSPVEVSLNQQRYSLAIPKLYIISQTGLGLLSISLCGYIIIRFIKRTH